MKQNSARKESVSNTGKVMYTDQVPTGSVLESDCFDQENRIFINNLNNVCKTYDELTREVISNERKHVPIANKAMLLLFVL